MKSRTLQLFALGTLLFTACSQQAGGDPLGGKEQLNPVSTSSTDKATGESPDQDVARARLSNFAWLTGSWHGAWGPRFVEQTWLAPKAGEMLGIFRVVENEKTLVIELISLMETPTGIEFRFRHFTPSLTAWEAGGATVLRLAGLDSKSAVFENSGKGQPKRNTLVRLDSDTYVSRTEILPDGNKAQATEIKYHREGGASTPLVSPQAGNSSTKKP